MVSVKKNRKGIIRVNKCFIDSLSYDDLSFVFKDIINFKVEFDPFIERYAFYCISKHFEDSKDGFELNEYIINLDSNDKGELINREIVKI